MAARTTTAARAMLCTPPLRLDDHPGKEASAQHVLYRFPLGRHKCSHDYAGKTGFAPLRVSRPPTTPAPTISPQESFTTTI
ncbi:uncharacterized protein N7518_001139 [Penicillium psychrosexuale]|uniref:uncharacterized protein n=1 Tax=Penicillium psychrosexuale TaxID=1002107 RepID=UPI002544F7A2|nr:uncharacterized protein N7518_001139 [Penicillium psychrosexuale]KAJ5799071.1 hypothetical protein N7518_001139 [Penicillium psychrosexuale]